VPEPEPIQDFIVLTVPPGVDPDDPEVRKKLEDQVSLNVMGQYKGKRPRALAMDPVEWLITSDWEDVERFQPAHDCAACRAGNDQAIAFLKEHPDKRLALGNLRYWEIW
jgi:hypothetical protein